MLADSSGTWMERSMYRSVLPQQTSVLVALPGNYLPPWTPAISCNLLHVLTKNKVEWNEFKPVLAWVLAWVLDFAAIETKT
jgi:hypothetical protein